MHMRNPVKHLVLITTSILALIFVPATGLAQAELPKAGGAALAAVPATADVLKAFHLSAATTQSLTVPATVAKPFKVDVILSGRRYTLDLQPYDVRSANFKLLVDDGKKITQVPSGPSTTYQGAIAGLAKTAVAASLVGGQLWAEIHTTGGVFAVQPINTDLPKYPRASHVVYLKRHVKNLGTRCEVLPPPVGTPRIGRGNSGNARLEAEIAIDADNAFYVRNGSNTTNTNAAVTRVINAVDVIYKRDIDVQYKITAILVRTVKVYAGTTTGTLLAEMRTRWNNNHGSIVRDLAHMFTGVGSFSGVIGTAYLSQICTSAAYGVSKAFHANLTTNTGLVAHETGHNWGAGHCNSNPPCYIMCSSLGGCNNNLTLFGGAAKAQMIAYKNSRSCLTPVGNPGTYTFYGAGCKGTGGGGCSTNCGSHNPSGGTLLTQVLVNEYCFGVDPSTSSRTVCGFQLYTQVVSGAAKTMTCAIYRQASATTPLATPAATGIMTVGTAAGFYTVRFTSPVIVPAGQRIWISQYDSNLVRACSLSAGASPALATYWRRPPGGGTAWSPTGIIRFPSWKLLCTSGGGGSSVPLLTNTAVPNINQTFGLQVALAKPNSTVFFWYGWSKTQWGSISLPLNLGFLGAPACNLHASYDILIGSTSNSGGVATTSFMIPNNVVYVGALFYNQAYVVDAGANAAGLALTRGGAGKVGK
jgi:hypothetical protein